jgi:predicted ATP-grasp superfamily ATP-dependent carboligase
MSDAPRILVSGVSARALAQAARRAGWAPTVLDAFGDRDVPGTVHIVSPFTPRRVVTAARGLDAIAVAVTSGWEHAPGALTQLAAGRQLLACPPAAIHAVRQPVRIARLLRAAGLPTLVTSAQGRTSPPYRDLQIPAAHAVRAWTRLPRGRRHAEPSAEPQRTMVAPWSAVVKPLRGGGGRGIVPFVDESPPDARGRYLQEWRDGTLVSLVVAANGRTGVPLALTRQFAGIAVLGAVGTTYAGSVVAAGGAATPGVPTSDARLRAQCAALAELLAREAGVRGLIGVDGIVDGDGVFWLLEINPRWCASFELLDRLLETPLFAIHAAACEGMVPEAWLLDAGAPRTAAKGVLYRDTDIISGVAPDLPDMVSRRIRLADIPHSGTSLPEGAPICTVLATARHATDAWQAVLQGAAHVRSLLTATVPC